METIQLKNDSDFKDKKEDMKAPASFYDGDGDSHLSCDI
jgi:hypothetical protein